MNCHSAFLALSVALLPATIPTCSAVEQEDVPASRSSETESNQSEAGVEGILVLRSGNLLRGKIVRLREHYRLDKTHTEMLIPCDRVEMMCRSIDEVYQRRRLHRTGSSADSHVELARWCLRNGLLEYAARELLDARSIDPENRQLQTVERQLQLAIKNRSAAKHNRVAKQNSDAPTPEDLRVTEDVPLWAKKLFVRQIQPLVIDSCATSGCHQVGSEEELQLNRLALDGPGHPGTTRRNLSAIVRQLDLKNPDDSPLLVHAREAHGEQGTRPPAALDPRKYHMLKTWVEQMAIAKENAPVREVELVQYEQDDAVDALPLIRNALQEEPKPLDPFDPSQFNQRNGGSQTEP